MSKTKTDVKVEEIETETKEKDYIIIPSLLNVRNKDDEVIDTIPKGRTVTGLKKGDKIILNENNDYVIAKHVEEDK